MATLVTLTTAAANKILDHAMGTAAWVVTTPVKAALTSTIGSAASAGTELVGGSYARQTFTAAAAAGGPVSNAADLLWSNLAAGDVAGVDVYDSTATPFRMWGMPLNPASFTVAAATDLFTVTGHGFIASSKVMFPVGQAPTGLTANVMYYVIASGLTANDFKISTTVGGSTVDVTADGSGTLAKVRTVAAGDSVRIPAGSLTLSEA